MRAFVAVWPPPDVVRRLAAIDRPARPGIRWTTGDQWHVTLQFLGEIDENQVNGEKASLAHMASDARLTPLVAEGGPSLQPLGPSILCVPVAGLETLAAAVVAATAGVVGPAMGVVGPVPGGVAPGSGVVAPGSGVVAPTVGPTPAADRPFRGHMTIARAARGIRRPWSAMAVPFTASWVVDEVTLVASTLHSAGARYEVVGRYPLADGT